MSLIQDALKRKSEETIETPPAEIPVETSELPAEEKTPRPLFSILSIVLISALLIILSGLGIYLILPKHPAPAPKTTSTAVTAMVTPAATPEPAEVLATSAPTVAPAPEPVNVEPVKLEPIKVDPIKAEPVGESVKKEEPAPVVQIVWPELKLTGMAKNNNQRIAILNGKMLVAGRKLGEVLVKEVHETDVVVEYLGERRVLYINE